MYVQSDARKDIIESLASELCANTLEHPLRLAIDGVTASGKSTLAREIAAEIRALGRHTIHLTMDGFHNHREQRYRRGRQSADGYYWDAYNFGALIDRVLVPLGPNGSRIYVESVIDLPTDRATDAPGIEAPRNSILIVDGTFLLRPPTAGHWDYSIFVDTDLGTARSRGIERDAHQMGGVDKTGDAYDTRYHAACALYLESVDPRSSATRVFDNN